MSVAPPRHPPIGQPPSCLAPVEVADGERERRLLPARVLGAGGQAGDDEVVAVTEQGDASADPPSYPSVTVLDYAHNPGAVTPTHLQLPTNLAYPKAKGGDPGLARIRAAVYNPDVEANPRRSYIAVLHSTVTGLSLALVRYDPPAEGASHGALTAVGDPVAIAMVAPFSGPIDLAAGDFDGDGNDELAVTALPKNWLHRAGDQRVVRLLVVGC